MKPEKLVEQLPEGHWRIELSQGAFALVSDSDIARIRGMRWRLHNRGYAITHNPAHRGHHIMMHRLIAGTPKHLETDHINGNRLDNRRENLRDVSRSENHMNMRRQARSAGREVGVRKHYNQWQAKLTKKGVGVLMAYFATEAEAVAQRRTWQIEHFGGFAAAPERLDVPTVPVIYPNKPLVSRTCSVCKRLFNGKRGPDGCCSTTCRERLRSRPVDG